MNCKFCGVENEKQFKYCINCGQELEILTDSELSNCSICGSSNAKDDHFCINCGAKLNSAIAVTNNNHTNGSNSRIKHKKKPRKSTKVKNNKRNKTYRTNTINVKPLLITVGIVIVTIIIAASFDLIFHKYPKNLQYQTEIRSNNPVLEANVKTIASKFICACGTCNEQPLETCACPTAIEERDYIRQELQQNKTPDNIVVSVANKYGWLKAEFASLYKVDKSRTWSNTALVEEQTKTSNNLLNNNTISKPATLADRTFIMSKFRCPCGQCNIDELLDCDCQHPGGAKEIKSFITNSIISGTKTVNQIIDEVNIKYGGKKI